MNSLKDIALHIRRLTIDAIYHAASGHPGGSLSTADLLTVLYFEEMRLNPEHPRWPERDRFVLSKGHACPALYAALALKGYFPIEQVTGLRRIDHFLEGHPDIQIPGVDAPSGSLGMGLSQGLGMAIGARLTEKPFRTYVILGDGDMQEGNTWEAIMCAGHHGVAGLTAILDANKLQGEGLVEIQMDYEPLLPKLEAFGWHVLELDGHDLGQIQTALAHARAESRKPSFLVARTLKGKGVSFMEHVPYWHGSVTMTKQQRDSAIEELSL